MKYNRFIAFTMIMAMLVVFVQCTNTGKDKEKAKKEETTSARPEKEEPRLVHDERGNIIERYNNSYRKADGSLRSIDSYFYTYDENNNVIMEVKESLKADSSFYFRNVNHYTYDDRNLLIDLVFESYDENGGLLRTAHHTYAYNDSGYKTEDVGYNEEGDVISRIILDPDETGALRSEEYIYYDENGTITDHKKYFYSKFGLEKTVDLLKENE